MSRHALLAALSLGVLTSALAGCGTASGTKPAAPAAAAGPAAEPTLKVGDPAPKLSVGKWVKGEPVSGFEAGKVYVVEFWATWCGPCKESIPHLTELQAKYRDQGLRVVGVDVWERDASLAEPFVKEMGDRMAYSVGIDQAVPIAPGLKAAEVPSGRSAADWLDAVGEDTLPTAFIVDRAGKVAWVGDPRKMDKALAQVFGGTFDPKAEAGRMARVEALNQQANKALQAKQFDQALALRDQIVAVDPDQADPQRVEKMVVLMQKGDAAGANALAAESAAAAEKSKNSTLAARTAAEMLNAPGREKTDKAVALRAAKLAYDGSDKSAQFGRLLAQAHAANNQFAEAAVLQATVVTQVKGPLKDQDQRTLAEYQAKAAQRAG